MVLDYRFYFFYMVIELLINFEREALGTVSHNQLLVGMMCLGWYILTILTHRGQDGKTHPVSTVVLIYSLFIHLDGSTKCLVTNYYFSLFPAHPYHQFKKRHFLLPLVLLEKKS